MVVFRRRLLAWSETFVAAQALALPRWRATFAGLSTDPAGLHLIGDRERFTLDAIARRPRLARWRLSALGLPDARWVAAIRATRPRLVHAHFASSAATALPLARALGVPLVATFHGYDVLDTSAGRRALARRARVFEQAALMTADSDFLRDALVRAGAPAGRVVRHYVGTDTGAGAAPDADAGTGSSTAGTDAPLVLFVGRLVAHKGCGDLLDAFARVRGALPDARLRVLGDGPERAALERRAAGIGHVEFAGVRGPEEVRRELARARVLCAPSRASAEGWREAFGLVFIEAQATGVPVVSCASGGIVEAVADGESGFLVPEGDVPAIAERLLRLLTDDALHARMARAGRARTVERFDLRRQCAVLETLYERALDAAPPR